jgi:hypothetical protein
MREVLMNILVVEPHPDDAFLSLSRHLDQWGKDGHEITIATYYGFPGRSSKKYADSIGARLVELNMRGEYSLGKDDGKHLKELLKDGGHILGCYWENFEAGELKNNPVPGDYDIILLPMAIYHPEHILVTKRFQGFKNILYYMDQPYYSRGYGQRMIHGKILLGEIISSPEEISGKLNDFKRMYPTENMTWDIVNLYKNGFAERIYK